MTRIALPPSGTAGVQLQSCDAPDARYQFERTGYFVKDVAEWSDERPVFNRTVTLRDS